MNNQNEWNNIRGKKIYKESDQDNKNIINLTLIDRRIGLIIDKEFEINIDISRNNILNNYGKSIII